MIKTEKLNIGYEQELIVKELNIEIPDRKITALVGANGSGKSTILKTIARLMKPKSGTITIDGKAIHTQKTKDIAKQLAILPQNPIAPEGLTVYELVTFGRYPHQKGMASLTNTDRDIIHSALEMTGIIEFANRSIDQLSGGQRQRAWIAMALAQDTPILFLDEPTTFLDMAHQIEVLTILEKLNHEQGRTIVMVVHDLNHASRYAQHIVAIKKGTVIKSGNPYDVMKEEVLEEVFGVKSDIITDPRTGLPLCLPYALTSTNDIDENATIGV
ncbi:ABC transporter ATP-binding protein [Metabacillus malikii]|uniref:Iron complex transport system ATP-binding protein n=1 Tax=Metabacillus malikii TaxID=1504265 RepID=A0ABT9ZFL4_9BACI|nr:ABC transporter ATP-binding protein [Metabacillus malikii]MDQ0230358.1 iron complex transport system ATP-binding protein [Metabacillus malikii]